MTPEPLDVTALRDTVRALHAELVRNGLVAWTSGNVSARVPGSAELMVIKPSGVSYDDLTPDSMVVCDLDGKPVSPGSLSPSSDAATHAYIYRHMPGVGGVVHTHSTYATAWAARGEAVPCVITAMADEFGGEIPVGPFALIGSDEIGRGGGGHADRTPLPRRFDAQPRRVHHRRHRAGRGQGRRDVRGRSADGAPGPRLRRAGAAACGPGGRAVRPLPEPLRPALTADKEKS
jgi:Class II Aldolase and Adducin N-terminal domain